MTTYRTLSTGSSPRMRGTRSKRIRIGGPPGIIPAYAGNTRRRSARRRSTRDHPRVCGEHPTLPVAREPMAGSSPRMRGTLHVTGGDAWLLGIIPAYAGNTRGLRWRVVSHKDHPRVCGEHRFGSRETQREWGSSPRMRGTLRRMRRVFFLPGIIPAYAGNTWCRWAVARCPWDHPRVCGEHPHFSVVNNGGAGSSPRMRGTRAERARQIQRRGIIPAYAGNTCSKSKR